MNYYITKPVTQLKLICACVPYYEVNLSEQQSSKPAGAEDEFIRGFMQSFHDGAAKHDCIDEPISDVTQTWWFPEMRALYYQNKVKLLVSKYPLI